VRSNIGCTQGGVILGGYKNREQNGGPGKQGTQYVPFRVQQHKGRSILGCKGRTGWGTKKARVESGQNEKSQEKEQRKWGLVAKTASATTTKARRKAEGMLSLRMLARWSVSAARGKTSRVKSDSVPKGERRCTYAE